MQVLADVYRPPTEATAPVVVWIHGGALINGHRGGISSRVRDYAFKRGFALVSIDYRLAPETKLPDIILDLKDALEWVHGAGASRFHFDRDRAP